MKKKNDIGRVDPALTIALGALIGIGILMVLSASMYKSAYYNSGDSLEIFIKQLILVFAGILLMAILSRINYRLFKSSRLAMLIFAVTVVLLIMVLLVGTEVNGGKRWINIGIGTFQPSELAKFAGIVYMAGALSIKPEITKSAKQFFIRCFLPIAILGGLTIIEPSMSAALVICFGMAAVIYLHGTSWKIMWPYAVILMIAVVGFLIAEPWRLERILVTFGSGTEDYQITQSLLAIASGGFLGKGMGNGTEKFLFLPEVQNDFIFANIAEELGFVGCALVIFLYAFIIYRCIKIGKQSPDRFGYLYTVSTALLIAIQVIINIGVTCGFVPVTGMALPFISAGGTSVVIFSLMMGPILNLSRQVDRRKRGKNE